MPPTIVIRDSPPSTWDEASNQTSQYQDGTYNLDPSNVGFIAPVAIFVCIVIMLFASCL